MNNYCLDCKKTISRGSKRCKSCAGKRRRYPNKKMPLRKNVDIEEICRLYVKENKTMREIAKIMDCSPNIIQLRLKKKGIKVNLKKRSVPYKKYYCLDCHKEIKRGSSIRCMKCNSIFNQGEKHPHYKNGINSYKSKAMKFIKRECSICKRKDNLCVHHKDFNRKNNKLSNLQIVCKSCHAKIHKRSRNFGDMFKIANMRASIKLLVEKYEILSKTSSNIKINRILEDLNKIKWKKK